MKTNAFTLSALLVLMCGGFAACDDTEDSHITGTPPASAPEEVSAFFETCLPPSSYSHSDPEFGFSEINYGESECFLINSMEEFAAIAPSGTDLPAIDFDKYSLLIGQYRTGDPGYKLDAQAVDIQSDPIIWNVRYKRLHGASPAVVTTFYFWGLYNKLPAGAAEANITIL